MKSVAFTTLGCKVNQYDTDAVKGMFLQKGYEVKDFEELADIYVINTCSVTAMGEKKSRQLIRKAKRQNNEACIVVMGCYAQLAPDVISAIDGVSLVVGTNDRHRIVDLVEEIKTTEEKINAVKNIMLQSDFEEMPLYGQEIEKARAYIKIQEGCNNYCSFCIIPYTRGKLKSRKPEDIMAEAKRLTDYGYKEVILTGIHLGNYGVEWKLDIGLADVVEGLLKNEKIERIRLGSIESVEVSDRLIELMKRNPRVCSHLHLPLQSGSNKILKLMNRHYDLEQFKSLVRRLRKEIPSLSITTDVIVGFPGEDDESFAETVDTIKEIGFTHIHVFPYSKREGTPAAQMKEQVPEAVKKARVGILNQLSREGFIYYASQWKEKEVHVLIESEGEDYYEGYTEEYVKARILKQGTFFPVGSIVKGTVKDINKEFMFVKV